MFNQPLTFEQKVNRIATDIERDARTILLSLRKEREARRQQAQREAYAAENRARNTITIATSASVPKGVQWGSKTLEFGKSYNLDGVNFQVHNPANLSAKQEAVVRRFIYDLYAPLNAPAHMAYEAVAPFIDVIFMFNRREISVGMFNKITKLNISIDTFDSHHQHNL